MRRVSLALVAVVVFGLSGVAGPLPVVAADEQTTGAMSEPAQRAFAQIGSCLSKEDSQLNVLYVLDASSSLEEDTDPERLRGKILAQAIDQLGGVAADRPVYFAVSSFDLGYQERRPWEQLTADNVSAAVSWADGQYSWWGAGEATDWESALSGGEATMRKSPNSKTACKMLVWLTDGGINVMGDFNDVDSNLGAMQRICAMDPATGVAVNGPSVMNGLRSSGVHVIGVLLQSDAFLQALQARGDAAGFQREKSKFSYVRSIVEGNGRVDSSFFTGRSGSELEFSCGATPIPADQASGALLIGDSPITLAYQFAALGNRVRGGQQIEVGETFPVRFEVERGINGLSVQLAGSGWQITSPDGEIVADDSAKDAPPGFVISKQGSLVNVRLEGPAVVPGTWQIGMKSPVAPAQVFIYSVLRGVIDIPQDARAGEPSSMTLAVLDGISGDAVSRSDYLAAEPEVMVGVLGSERLQLACTPDPVLVSYTCPWTPSAVGSVAVSARLVVETVGGSYAYTYLGEFKESVAPSAEFPQISPDSVELSDLNGRNGSATGTLTLIGPERGSGEICIPSAGDIRVVSDVMERQSSYLLSGPELGSCVSLAQGEKRTIQISVSNSVAATGTVTAGLPFTLKSSESEQVAEQQVSVSFESIRQGTPPWWLLLLLVVAGFGLPIALLYAQARAAARLTIKGLQMANVSVTLMLDGDVVEVSRSMPPSEQLFALDDWQYLPLSLGKPRSFMAGAGAVVSARVPRNPLGPISAVVRAASGTRLVSSRKGGPSDGPMRGAFGGMTLNPANQWFIVVTEADLLSDASKIPATLVGFAQPGGGNLEEIGQAIGSAVLDVQAQTAWGGIRRELRSMAPDVTYAGGDSTPTTRVDANDPFGPVAGADTRIANDPFGSSAAPFAGGASGPVSAPVADPFGRPSTTGSTDEGTQGISPDPFKL